MSGFIFLLPFKSPVFPPQVRNLCYMVSRREKLKLSHSKVHEQVFNLQVQLINQEIAAGNHINVKYLQILSIFKVKSVFSLCSSLAFLTLQICVKLFKYTAEVATRTKCFNPLKYLLGYFFVLWLFLVNVSYLSIPIASRQQKQATGHLQFFPSMAAGTVSPLRCCLSLQLRRVFVCCQQSFLQAKEKSD